MEFSRSTAFDVYSGQKGGCDAILSKEAEDFYMCLMINGGLLCAQSMWRDQCSWNSWKKQKHLIQEGERASESFSRFADSWSVDGANHWFPWTTDYCRRSGCDFDGVGGDWRKCSSVFSYWNSRWATFSLVDQGLAYRLAIALWRVDKEAVKNKRQIRVILREKVRTRLKSGLSI